MTTEATIGHRSNEIPTHSDERPDSTSVYPRLNAKSGTAVSGGRATYDHKPPSLPSKRYYTRRSTRGTHYAARDRPTSQNVRRRPNTRRTMKTRRNDAVKEYTEANKRLLPIGTPSGRTDSLPRSPQSCAPEAFPNDRERDGAENTKPQSQSKKETEPDTALVRHRALKKLEDLERRKASEKYQETGDMSVFAPFMAPFIDRPDKPNLGSWVWDKSTERWRREHELEGRIIWGPTDDSFI